MLPSDLPRPGNEDSSGPAPDADSGVEVIVVAFGAPELLDACLNALGGQFPVVVVDNGSDAEVRAIADGHGASYVDPGSNLGFAAGVNRALAHRRSVEADVLLLNPDAVISSEGVRSLHRCLHQRSELACVAPRQTDPFEFNAVPCGLALPHPGRRLGGRRRARRSAPQARVHDRFGSARSSLGAGPSGRVR